MKTFRSSRKIFPFFVIIVLILYGNSKSSAEEPKKQEGRKSGSSAISDADKAVLNVSAISHWIYADGRSAYHPWTGKGGISYYNGHVPMVYQDGLIWGGIVRDGREPALRVGGQAYRIGTQPGWIVSKGIASDPNTPGVNHVWRVRRNIRRYDEYIMQRDAAEFFGVDESEVTRSQMEDLWNRYVYDWEEWPWQNGAPFYDADGDGIYRPFIYSEPILFPDADEPGIANADQVIWMVCNDLDSTKTKEFTGSPPIGMEVQITLWAYARSDAIGNVIFKRVRLIYKGTENTPADARIDSMFIGQWSDTDIGIAEDDLVGCDPHLNLGFAYNFNLTDNTYGYLYNAPPAVGYDIFAGPIVPEAGSVAIFGMQRRVGFRNLPMTTFGYFTAESAQDPATGNYDGTLHWWNLMNGRKPRTGESWRAPDALGGGVTMFPLSGDPISGGGWIDTDAGDRRLFLASGPFSMALGDTNEIIIGIVGGYGMDRLLSVLMMKYYDKVAQGIFDNLFELPNPPPVPQLSATELDEAVLLNWSQSQEAVDAVEKWQEMGYRFEGYNVYQLPSADDPLYRWSEWIKLATYDVDNDVAVIVQEDFDPNTQSVVMGPVQNGTNSGIVRSLLIERDKIGNYPFINGEEYYFGVSAYSYNPDPNAVVKSLECWPAIVTVVPQKLRLGQRLHAAMGDTIPAVHSQGVSDGSVVVIVKDPLRLTGDAYKVGFREETGGSILWYLVNTTTGDTLLNHQTNQSGNGEYIETEGFQAKVIGPPSGSRAFTAGDAFTFLTMNYQQTITTDDALEDVHEIKIYPNPYYESIGEYSGSSYQFVTFSHLPRQAVIRIFNLAGQMIRRIEKDDDSQFARWDLLNSSGRLASSGMYIAHVELPELGAAKVLKFCVFHME
ncbi:MAG: T9SS type A sorting domain-containing protein [bacterium]